MDQIEKFSRILARLVARNQLTMFEAETLDEMFGVITGIPREWLTKKDGANGLTTLVGLVQDENKRALAAAILYMKDKDLYGACYESIITQIDVDKLDPKIKDIIHAL